MRSIGARNRWMKAIGILVLVLWGAWSYQGASYRVFTVLPQQPSLTIDVLHSFRQDKADHRIYLQLAGYMPAPWIFNPLIDDQGDFLLFNRQGNDVPRFPDGYTPNIVLYYYGIDKITQDRLAQEYPQGRLVPFKRKDSPPGDPPSLYRFYIDGKDLRPDPKLLFRAINVPPNSWCRRYFFAFPYHFGLGHGVIEREEWVSDPLQPSPLIQSDHTAVVKGTVQIGKSGKYLFAVQGGNYAVLDIGGKRVLDYRPTASHPGKSRRYVTLKAGTYQAVLRVWFLTALEIPKVEVLCPDESMTRPLGSF